jgi:hypothetical protein
MGKEQAVCLAKIEAWYTANRSARLLWTRANYFCRRGVDGESSRRGAIRRFKPSIKTLQFIHRKKSRALSV